MTATPLNKHPDGAGGERGSVPLVLRAAGALTFLAAILALLGLVSIFYDGLGAPFGWTWQRVALIAAAILVGAFSAEHRDQRGSFGQIAALLLALVFIIASRVLPDAILATMGQYLLPVFAVIAALCAALIRRAVR
ncbi:hypothetical protein ACKFRM_09355 [Corynebacterium sp. YSMAA1_1_D6]|uniref:hypothetical protein n=1 Tax=Corynebacterium sp. YSMAA1_1_D6 TaxID=3383589 RepID=UPI0038D188C8